MKLRVTVILIALVLALAAVPALAAPGGNACWGQATAVFARTGEMGEHASQEPTPRLGLRNLARALHDAGVIANSSMAALGQFVATSLVDENGEPLTIEACMD